MWIYKGVKYLCRGKQGELKDGEVPKYDSNGKPISITYFQDGWDWLLKGLTITANLLAGGSIGLFAWLLFKLADTLFDSAGGTWQLWIVYMALDCVLLGVLLTLGTFFAEWSAERQLLKIRQRFLKEVMRQDISYFDGYDATALASKLMMNTRLVRDLIGIRTSMAYMYIGVIVALLEVAFQNQAGVAGVSLCVLPVIVLSGWWAGRIEYKATLKVKESNETANSVALEAITNMRTVKAFNMQDTMKARYGVCADIAENVVNKASVKTGFGYGFYWLCIFCASAFGYWYGSHVL
ncbi:putative ABC transporter, partial [Gregarina niphandrodes]